MTPALRHVLSALLAGQQLVSDRHGWSLLAGIGRERVQGDDALALIEARLIHKCEVARESATYAITEAGTKALTEEPTP